MSESSAATPPDARDSGAVAPAPADSDEAAAPPRSGRPRRRRQWREGGTSTRRWGWEIFGWAVLLLGVGILGSATVPAVVGGVLGVILSRLVLWVAFAAAIAIAFARSRPRGLLRFRPVDALYAVVLGGALRLAQGGLEIAAGGSGAWPAYPSLAGQLPPGWWYDQLLTAGVIAPVLEELYFRGVILVAVYTGVRRLAGRGVAAFAAAVASTALFVLAHAVLQPQTWDVVASLSLVGLVCSILVLTTGRIWGAVLVHVVYNLTFVALATIGTLLSA